MKLNKLIVAAFAGSLLFVSCSNDDDAKVDTPSGAYDNGVIVLNEGGFGAGNASASYISDAMVLENNIFSAVNSGDLLGDTAQDLGFVGDLAYIVLNGSNKIEIVNRYTFVKVATISTGLVNPRFVEFENGKAYVTCWGDGNVTTDDYVAVIDLATRAISTKISVAEGPERIVEENGKLYVAHKGGYGSGNKITVINTANDTVATTITVGDVPNSLEVENGNLYVLCGGLPYYAETETAGRLDVISLATNTVTRTVNFTESTDHPGNLTIEDDKIYYTLDNAIYTMALNATTLPAASLFTTTPQGSYGVYSFAVEDNHIYVGDAGDYSANGQVHVYSTQGALQKSFTAGVIPTGFYFND